MRFLYEEVNLEIEKTLGDKGYLYPFKNEEQEGL